MLKYHTVTLTTESETETIPYHSFRHRKTLAQAIAEAFDSGTEQIHLYPDTVPSLRLQPTLERSTKEFLKNIKNRRAA